MIVRVDIQTSLIDGASHYEYAADVTGNEILKHAPDMSYVLIDAPDDFVPGPGIAEATVFDRQILPDEPELPLTMSIVLSADEVSPGVEVIATIDVRLGGAPAPVSGVYYVPVLGVDGVQKKLLKADVIDGQATVPFALTEQGIYTLDLTKLKPVPVAKLANSPELVVF